MNCGKCHTCGGRIHTVLDGEERCSRCGRYQRPRAHGWGLAGEPGPCPVQPSAEDGGKRAKGMSH